MEEVKVCIFPLMSETSDDDRSRNWNPDLRVLVSLRMDLSKVNWRLDLCSPFWRIYVNDRSGAYIEHNGKRMELGAKTVWIIPARVRFQTGYRNSVVQDFLHFTFGGFPPVLLSRFDCPVRLKTAGAIRVLLDQWQGSMPDNDSFYHLCLAGAVVHACMSALLSDHSKLGWEDCRYWFAQTHAIQRALERLEAVSGRPPNNRELGRLCGMSEDHFIRRFRDLMGVTPAEHGRRLRVAKAAEWLARTSRSIDEIAEASGFVDRSHFSRVFRLQLGCPPAAFRRMHRLEVE